MEKYYIGGVANVEAFAKNPSGGIMHYFTAKTLTDSNIEISVSSNEIRGGGSARLLGKYYHTSDVKITLTDVCFNMKYLASTVGSEVSYGTTAKPVEIGDELFGVVPIDGVLDEPELYQTMKTEEFFGLSDGDSTKGDIELKYVSSNKQIVVNSTYKPKEFILFLKAKLFSGTCKNISTAKCIGDVVIEIPRFQPDGNVDLNMASTSAANISITGSALINDCGCGAQGWYSKITDVMLSNKNKYDGYTSIAIANKNELYIGSSLNVYAFGNGHTPKKMSPGEYTISGTAVDNRGRVIGTGEIMVVAVAFKAPTIILEIGR